MFTYNIALLAISLYFIGFSFAMHTRNFGSSFLFKIVPFLSGMTVSFGPLKYFGIL